VAGIEMAWKNQDQVLYHGTNNHALQSAGCAVSASLTAMPLPRFSAQVGYSARAADFGQGFYTTTSLHQAREWANEGVRRLANQVRPISAQGCVLCFSVPRNALAALDTLAFVIASDGYFDFVEHCRLRPGLLDHGRGHPQSDYQIVIGPVSMGYQRLIIHDCDQMSFHDQKAANSLLANPTLSEYSTNVNGQLP
jgi:Protein of unknown function (DUF3990)